MTAAILDATLATPAPAPRVRAVAPRAAAASHTGRVRAVNEDRAHVSPDGHVFAVADGMGGHEGGVLASTTLVEALATIGTPVSAADLLARLEDRVVRANGHLRATAAARGATIGATVAILLIYGGDYACIWSGDSRVYRVRGGVLARLTRDHSEVQELIDCGILTPEEGRTWSRRNVVTRAIGVRDEPELELEQGPLEPGDVFVLCSDGLTAHVEDEEIQEAVEEAVGLDVDHVARRDPRAVCERLLGLCLERGASDNVTVVCVAYGARRP